MFLFNFCEKDEWVLRIHDNIKMEHPYVIIIKSSYTYLRFLKVSRANCAFDCVGTILSQHVLISSSALCPLLCLFQKSRWQNYYKLCPYSNHWNTVMSRSNWQIWRPTILGSFGKSGSITANNRNVPLLKVQGPPGSQLLGSPSGLTSGFVSLYGSNTL